jgi:hypothetical protein
VKVKVQLLLRIRQKVLDPCGSESVIHKTESTSNIIPYPSKSFYSQQRKPFTGNIFVEKGKQILYKNANMELNKIII